jgi:hypothetical protein
MKYTLAEIIGPSDKIAVPVFLGGYRLMIRPKHFKIGKVP